MNSMKTTSLSVIVIALASQDVQAQFNNPPGVDIWCGKAYRAANASFNPGGQFAEPAKSYVPLLNLKATPRMSLYLEDETLGSFLINASISSYIGEPYYDWSGDGQERGHDEELSIQAYLNGHQSLLERPVSVTLGSVTEVPFNLSSIPTGNQSANVTVVATTHSNATFYAQTQVTRLPVRRDNGTTTRLDYLYGGMAVRKGSEVEWKPIFPYTYYVQWSLYWNANISTLDAFSALGYNLIHIVPTGDLGDTPFPWDEFEPYLSRADELGILFQFDVRWEYANLTTMVELVQRLKDHPSLLLWYTGDEPDGKSNPINSTRIAYETIRDIDPYHPVSLALNCYDFYYEDYASGAEIILSDVYPISTNTSWSTVYETPCNATYGCCGCDDCHGHFEDISDRLDHFAHFDDVLDWEKVHWGAPQAFGNETFWTRYPTAAEEVVMNMLSVNHGAKGIVIWDFPTTAQILNVTNRLAGVLTSDSVAEFLIGSPRVASLAVDGGSRVDATAWSSGDQLLLSVINLNYGDLATNMSVHLPNNVTASGISTVLWGATDWRISKDGQSLYVSGLLGLDTSILLLDL